MLDAGPAPFCLELAALAARREYLNLDKWLADQFTAKGSAFMQVRRARALSAVLGGRGQGQPAPACRGGGLEVERGAGRGAPLPACRSHTQAAGHSIAPSSTAPSFPTPSASRAQAAVSFLDSKLRSEQPALQTAATATQLPGAGSPAGGGRIALSEGSLEVFLRVLAGNAGLLPSDTLQQFKVVQAAAVQAHPGLAAVVGDSSRLEAFAPDIGALGVHGRPAAAATQLLLPLLPPPPLLLHSCCCRCCRHCRCCYTAAAAGCWVLEKLARPRLRYPAPAHPPAPHHRLPPPPLSLIHPPRHCAAAEEEANAYFQRVYAGEIGVEELVRVLRAYKHSTLGREQVGAAAVRAVEPRSPAGGHSCRWSRGVPPPAAHARWAGVASPAACLPPPACT